nr:MAG TPA: hypothetical protein [Bacteriophage sp.]
MYIYICDTPFDRDTFSNVSLDKIYDYYSQIDDSNSKIDKYHAIDTEIDTINQEICVLRGRIIELEKEKYRLFGDNSSFLISHI